MNPSSMIRAVLSPSRGAVHGRSVGPWAMMGHAMALMAITNHQRPGPHHGGRFRIQRAVPLFRSASPPSPRRRVRNSVPHIPLPRAEAAISTRTSPLPAPSIGPSPTAAAPRPQPPAPRRIYSERASVTRGFRRRHRHPPARRPLASQVKSSPSPPPSSHHRKLQPNHLRGRGLLLRFALFKPTVCHGDPDDSPRGLPRQLPLTPDHPRLQAPPPPDRRHGKLSSEGRRGLRPSLPLVDDSASSSFSA